LTGFVVSLVSLNDNVTLTERNGRLLSTGG